MARASLITHHRVRTLHTLQGIYMQRLTTRSGLDLPAIGLGTWPMTGTECTQAVHQALDVGYRHIDTATAYENEAAVGQALRDSDVPREQIHLTTKVWWDRLEPKAMRQSLEDSLRALGTEQVDLFHIHWPGKDWDLARSIDTLVALRDEGKARHIGVANFPLGLLRQVVETLGRRCRRSRWNTTCCSASNRCWTTPATMTCCLPPTPRWPAARRRRSQ